MYINVTIGEPYYLLICPPFSGIIKHLSWAGTTGHHWPVVLLHSVPRNSVGGIRWFLNIPLLLLHVDSIFYFDNNLTRITVH